jgi:hypothetical protein
MSPLQVGGEPMGSFAARVGLTVVGSVAMIAGAFLQWVNVPNGLHGTELPIRVLWSTRLSDYPNLVGTVGFVILVLGVVALLGLGLRTGWLTRLAAALGFLTFVASVITLYRATGETFSLFGIGAWLVLIGSILALIGGFMGQWPVVERVEVATTGQDQGAAPMFELGPVRRPLLEVLADRVRGHVRSVPDLIVGEGNHDPVLLERGLVQGNHRTLGGEEPPLRASQRGSFVPTDVAGPDQSRDAGRHRAESPPSIDTTSTPYNSFRRAS